MLYAVLAAALLYAGYKLRQAARALDAYEAFLDDVYNDWI